MAELKKVAYICDRKQCGDACSYPVCSHTTDINHAVNFEKGADGVSWMEKPIDDAPVWDFEDAVNFIHERTDVNYIDIKTVLEAEMEYMKSIGLIEEES